MWIEAFFVDGFWVDLFWPNDEDGDGSDDPEPDGPGISGWTYLGRARHHW